MEPGEIAVLFFCIDTLQTLAEKEPEHAWLWRSKEKIAWFRIAQCESEMGLSSDDCPLYSTTRLTEEEQEEILQSHPLLQRPSDGEMKKAHSSSDDWFDEIRKKVEKYFDR